MVKQSGFREARSLACYNFLACPTIHLTTESQSGSFATEPRSRLTTTGPRPLLKSGSKPSGRSPTFACPGTKLPTVNPDFKELLLAFNAHNVEYLIVGAHALAAHGHVRATKDLDLWVRPETSNAHKVLQALSDFGAPLGGLTVDDLDRKNTIFQIGLPPLRIDIITNIDGVEFAEAWPDRLQTLFGGVPAFVISRDHLIRNKKASARLQDLADVQQLEARNDRV